MPCGASLEIGWIPVRRTVDRDEDVQESDHVDIAIRLLPILEKRAQDTILAEQLEKRGWARQPDGSLSKTFGDVVATLQPGGDSVRIEVSAERRIKASATATGRSKEEDIAAQDAIGAKAARDAEAKLAIARDNARADLVRENIDRLEGVQQEVAAEIAEAVTATTRRALEQRASEIGSIQSVVEKRGENGYEVEIVVRT